MLVKIEMSEDTEDRVFIALCKQATMSDDPEVVNAAKILIRYCWPYNKKMPKRYRL